MMQGTRRLSPSLARDARKVLITGVRIQPFIAPKLRFLESHRQVSINIQSRREPALVNLQERKEPNKLNHTRN